MRKRPPLTKHARRDLIAEEAFLISRSGEIPEVALHNSLHYLVDDPEGPGFELMPAERKRLMDAVVDCYRRIILRDLTPRLRGTRVYRGIDRCIVNWARLQRFLQREGRSAENLRCEIGAALGAFCRHLQTEADAGMLHAGVAVAPAQLEAFGKELGVPPASLGAARICRR